MTLVSRPAFIFGHTAYESKYYWGVGFGLGAAIFAGINYVLVSAIKNDVHSLVLLWYTGLIQILIAVIAAFYDDKGLLLTPNILDIPPKIWIAMSIISVLGILAFFTNTEACKKIEPSLVSFVRALEIVFAMVADFLYFQHLPDYLSFIGSGLVVFSVFAKGLEEPFMKWWNRNGKRCNCSCTQK